MAGLPVRTAFKLYPWESEPPMVYGRFDFALAPDGHVKLLEYNADTPTALVETAVQWHWLIDVFGEGGDQWNSVHEALVARWSELRPRLPGDTVHFLHTSAEKSGEDFMTVAYMVETARAAGLNGELMPIEKLGLAPGKGFVDMAGLPVRTAFKLYPWEWIVHEPYGREALERMGDREGETVWIEPIWKMLWSNKGILAVLWELFEGHDNLVPAYFEADGPELFSGPLASFVRKPLLAREGADAQVWVGGELVDRGPEQGYGEEGHVVQQYVDPGVHDGARPVLGVWTVDMEPAGLGIRESDGHITNNLSRFVPHAIEG
jgi:glutathionylspermidine synthase